MDIVEILKDPDLLDHKRVLVPAAISDAADEIERLRAELETAERALDAQTDFRAEIARLRSELTEARKPDCRSCRYYFEIEEDCFLLRKNERCINASEYEVQGAPVRLYERGE